MASFLGDILYGHEGPLISSEGFGSVSSSIKRNFLICRIVVRFKRYF